MAEFNWNKTSRPELTLAQMDSIITLIEQCEPDVDVLCLEVKARYKLVLLKEDAGVLTGTGIKKDRPPRKNSLAGLGFTGSGGSSSSGKSAMTDEMHIAALNKSFEHLFKDAPVYNEKQVAWIAFDNGNLGKNEDVDHLHTPDSKYEWLNELHKGRIPPGKTRFNEGTGLYE